MNMKQEEKALALGKLLVNQEAAQIVIPALSPEPGFWFGGGECMRDLDEHKHAAKRPRGYFCKELVGWAGLRMMNSMVLNVCRELNLPLPAPMARDQADTWTYSQPRMPVFSTWQQSQDEKSHRWLEILSIKLTLSVC